MPGGGPLLQGRRSPPSPWAIVYVESRETCLQGRFLDNPSLPSHSLKHAVKQKEQDAFNPVGLFIVHLTRQHPSRGPSCVGSRVPPQREQCPEGSLGPGSFHWDILSTWLPCSLQMQNHHSHWGFALIGKVKVPAPSYDSMRAKTFIVVNVCMQNA